MGTLPINFDEEAHRKYVEAGGCPYVDDKTWCNGRKDDLHQDHWASYWYYGVKVKKVKFRNPEKIKYKGE